MVRCYVGERCSVWVQMTIACGVVRVLRRAMGSNSVSVCAAWCSAMTACVMVHGGVRASGGVTAAAAAVRHSGVNVQFGYVLIAKWCCNNLLQCCKTIDNIAMLMLCYVGAINANSQCKHGSGVIIILININCAIDSAIICVCVNIGDGNNQMLLCMLLQRQ